MAIFFAIYQNVAKNLLTQTRINLPRQNGFDDDQKPGCVEP